MSIELRVQKLVKLTPRKYAMRDIFDMADAYGKYMRNLEAFSHSKKLDVVGRNAIEFKSFERWLDEEAA